MDLNTELAALHDEVLPSALLRRKFGPGELRSVIAPLVEAAPGLEREEIGRSALDRPLHLLRHGSGSTRVLLWSQMHGDEPTATMAVADLVRLLAEHPDDARVRRWAERLTLLVLPILNPDGAARFQRRNAQGIDLNRDARKLLSPELRALDAVHRRYEPGFAFNLHDEDTKTRVGKSDRMSAMSLLAPAVDESLGDNDARLRAKRLCVAVKRAVEPLVGEHLARYSESYTPTSIGETLQARGTATVLVESGWWPQDAELQFLRKVNFVGLVAALDAIATGGYERMPLEEYESVPENDRDVFDVLVRGGKVVLPGTEPYAAEVGVNFEVALDLAGGHVADVGDLSGYSARDILIASGLFVHPHPEALGEDPDGGAHLEVGRPASLSIRRGADPESEAVWVMERGVARRVDEP